MARLFSVGSSEYCKRTSSSPGQNGYPYAMAGWFRAASFHNGVVLGVGNNSTGDYDSIQMRTSGKVRAQSFISTSGVAEVAASYSTITWSHLLGTFASTTDRRCILDNGTKATNTTSVSALTIDAVSIGVSPDSSPFGYYNGRIAEVGFWNLSGWPGGTPAAQCDEFERVAAGALAAGASPALIPQGLEAYWPLGGPYSQWDDDIDVVGNYDLTPFNTPTTAGHPTSIFCPTEGLYVPQPPPPAGGTDYVYPHTLAPPSFSRAGVYEV